MPRVQRRPAGCSPVSRRSEVRLVVSIGQAFEGKGYDMHKGFGGGQNVMGGTPGWMG